MRGTESGTVDSENSAQDRSDLRWIHRTGRHVGLRNLHRHTLRHVQDRAGHVDPKATAVYVVTESQARRRQIERLEGQQENL